MEGYNARCSVDVLLIEQLQRLIPDSPRQLQQADIVMRQTINYIKYLEDFEKVVRGNPEVYGPLFNTGKNNTTSNKSASGNKTAPQTLDQSFEEARLGHVGSSSNHVVAQEYGVVPAKTKRVGFSEDGCYGDPGAIGDPVWAQTLEDPSFSGWQDQVKNYEDYSKYIVEDESVSYCKNNNNYNNNNCNKKISDAALNYSLSSLVEKPKNANKMFLIEKEKQSLKRKATYIKVCKSLRKPASNNNSSSRKAKSKETYQKLSPKPHEISKSFCKVTVPTTNSSEKNSSTKKKESSKDWIFKSYKSFLQPKKFS